MGFEVFDDVAFYYLSQSLLFIFIFPPTAYFWYCKLTKEVDSKTVSNELSLTNNYEEQGTFIQGEPTFREKYFKLKFIVAGVLWLIFLARASQFNEYQSSEMASFDPVTILEVSPDATDDEIKQAYRKLSLQWHPDKNPDNKEAAEEKFIMISKAYKTLTNPKAKANFLKFGNADGFQGSSMTIGLPSMLTKEENHLRILLVYFIIMIMIPPVIVFIWWSTTKHLHETGVLRDTLGNYGHFITEHMSAKLLITVLASSVEYKPIGVRDNSTETEADRKRLRLQVQEHMAKHPMHKVPYILNGTVLLHAYCLRIPVPESLQADLKLLLSEAHRLCSVMFTLCVATKKTKASMACVDLMQMLTQAMWPTMSPLMQVPFLTQREIRMAGRVASKKHLKEFDAFRYTSLEDKKKIYGDHTVTEWTKMDKVVKTMPDMKMTVDTEVEGEKGVYEGDIVTVIVELKRLLPAQTKDAPIITDADETAEIKDDDKEDEEQEDDLSDDEEAEKLASEELDLLETLPTSEHNPKFGKNEHGAMVHSAFFPFPKYEKWVLVLLQKNAKARTIQLVTVQRVRDFMDLETVKLRLRVEEKGKWTYELHALCDSYVGCDVSMEFNIRVEKMSAAVEERRAAKMEMGKLEGLDDDEEEEEEDYEGKWYYAGFASIWELLLNMIVLGLLGVFVVNFLQTRGYWAKYVDPILAKALGVLQPALDAVSPVLSPVLSVIGGVWNTLASFVVIDPDDLIKARFQEDL